MWEFGCGGGGGGGRKNKALITSWFLIFRKITFRSLGFFVVLYYHRLTLPADQSKV